MKPLSLLFLIFAVTAGAEPPANFKIVPGSINDPANLLVKDAKIKEIIQVHALGEIEHLDQTPGYLLETAELILVRREVLDALDNKNQKERDLVAQQTDKIILDIETHLFTEQDSCVKDLTESRTETLGHLDSYHELDQKESIIVFLMSIAACSHSGTKDLIELSVVEFKKEIQEILWRLK